MLPFIGRGGSGMDCLFYFHFLLSKSSSFSCAAVNGSEALHTSSYHKLELLLQLQADVLLKGDEAQHCSSLLCLEILCHRKYTELETPLSTGLSQAVQEKPALPSYAVLGSL